LITAFFALYVKPTGAADLKNTDGLRPATGRRPRKTVDRDPREIKVWAEIKLTAGLGGLIYPPKAALHGIQPARGVIIRGSHRQSPALRAKC